MSADSFEPLRHEGALTTRSVSLDIERLERGGHSLPARGRSIQSEEFRRIKQHLLETLGRPGTPSDRRGLIGITSALPGEGKTSTAINLAFSIAMEIDRSVLLVDADVLRPNLLLRLGMDPTPGLLDLLSTPGLELEDVVLHTNVPKFSVLPAGRSREDAAELITSRTMDELLATLSAGSGERVVIFDSPPILLSTEARALARSMGQVVVVVEAGKTPRSAVLEAFGCLEDRPNVVALLNKTARAQTYGYDDYYG